MEYEAVSCVLKFKKNKKNILVNINCNWMEPVNYFQKSRQNIEIITEKFHIFSDQANRGFNQISETGYEEPNNYFTFYDKIIFQGMATKVLKLFSKFFEQKRSPGSLEEHDL